MPVGSTTYLGTAVVGQNVLTGGSPFSPLCSSTLGTFAVGDGHLASLNQCVSVPSVYPSGFVKSITGQVTSGDGHVSLGVPSGQFGAITFLVSTAQTKPVGGVPSAQAFGSLAFRVTLGSGGVLTAQAFGAITTTITRAPQSKAVGGVPSAQAFGAITVKTTVKTTVVGIGSAQAFGSPATAFIQHILGVGSVQAFGALSFRTGFTKQVGGVPSAQAFGTPKAVWPQSLQVGGIPSAQVFGALTIKGSIKPQAGGVPSAQAFGSIHLVYRQFAPVGGVPSAQAFGDTATGMSVVNVWLYPSDCISSPDDSICGFPISGDGHVCGGESFVKESDCISSPSPAILDEFLVGDGTVVGGHSFVVESLCLDGDPPLLGVAVLGVAVISYGFLGTTSVLDLDAVASPSYSLDLEPVEAV